MQTSAKRSSQNKSMAFLMDAWTFCIRTTNYFQSGEGKNLFRDQQPLAIQAAARVQKAVETVARKHIAADQLPDVIRSLESYARANPMHGIFVHEVPESFSAGHEGKNVLSHVLDVPLGLIRSGWRALDPTSPVAVSVDRFTELMADYPALYSQVIGNLNPTGTRDELVGTCPYPACRDKKKDPRFYVNKGTGQFHCKRCGKGGNAITFARDFTLDEKLGWDVSPVRAAFNPRPVAPYH
ncbi:MAG: hypothetical protein IH987_19095, partial [Planctomycetes bacterium]|nr:hypothetical protein [Planctomycetota bacterium]